MIQLIKTTLNDLLAFLKNPVDQQDQNQNIGFKSKNLLSILALDVLIMLVLLAVLYIIENTGLIDTKDHRLLKLIEQVPLWLIFIIAVIILPFIEEIIFRLYLRLKHNYPLQFLFFILSAGGKKQSESVVARIENKWHKYYKIIFYFSAVLFALIHLVNYDISPKVLVFAPLLFAPQFLVGLLTGYIRVKFGFLWGFYLHALHNLIFLLPVFLVSSPIEKLNIANDNFQLKIEEVRLSTSHPIANYYNDSTIIRNMKINRILPGLLGIDEKLVIFDSDDKSDIKINVKFLSLKDSLDSKQLLLNELMQLYNYTFKREKLEREAWCLQIIDTLLLMKQKSDETTMMSGQSFEDEIIFKNIDLNGFVSYLNRHFDPLIISEIDLAVRFNFLIQKGSFDELVSALQSNYGLLLEKNNIEIEHIIIEVKNDI